MFIDSVTPKEAEWDIRCVVHAFHTTRDGALVTSFDGLGGEHDGLETKREDLVDRGCE